MNDRHLKLKDAIEVVRETVTDEYIESTLELRLLDKSLIADVRENVTGKWIDITMWHDEYFGNKCQAPAKNVATAVNGLLV